MQELILLRLSATDSLIFCFMACLIWVISGWFFEARLGWWGLPSLFWVMYFEISCFAFCVESCVVCFVRLSADVLTVEWDTWLWAAGFF
jgi:hypothetical protein